MLADIESMDSHIVIAGKHVDRSIGHLHINVGVPRQDLSHTVREHIVTGTARGFESVYFAVPPPA